MAYQENELTDEMIRHPEYRRDHFVVSADPAKLDAAAIHDFLTHCYWSEGIPRATVERALKHSLCFGLFDAGIQIGFARVISDYATYAYLCDVYVLESYRGKGLGTWLMSCVMKHPDLQGLRRFTLLTRDAHRLYRKFGFAESKNPSRYMEIHDAQVYKRT
jgi:GNAT superfamily N-acetyltransferase